VAAAAGIFALDPSMVAYGAAMLCGVALSRALTRVSVARARAAGFEMLWTTDDPLIRLTRGQEKQFTAELRNRDNLPTRFRNLQVTAAPGLDVRCFPENGEVPAKGRLVVTVSIRAKRVGYHGVHSLTLQTIRAPGLYTIPLSFSNPLVLEVLPHPVQLSLKGARGGRAQSASPLARMGRKRGEGTELRELREHRPGDPYRKIAWKASARRGRLLIIEKEQEQSDVVWIVIDASVDSCSGPPGASALDQAIDSAVTTLESHLARGDSVGLALVGTRRLARLKPGRGPKHTAAMISALTLRSHTMDADRSDWDDNDVARRALEHVSSLDIRGSALRSFEHEKIAELAAQLQRRAPAPAEAPWSASRTDQVLRQYLLSFGIQSPPRGTSDRHHTEREIANLLRELQGERPRPTLLYLYGRPPTFETPKHLLETLKKIPKQRTEIRFQPMLDPTALVEDSGAVTERGRVVNDVLAHRQRIAAEDGMKALSALGVKGQQRRKRRKAPRAQSLGGE